jgi:hypothetical protein
VSGPVLLVEVADGVARVTLNRPEVRNALDAALLGALEAALRRLEDDPAARVVVLAGAGERAFCAGADLKGVADRGTTLQARESFGGLARILEHMAKMRTPVIARVHGYALAGGCGLAAGADIVIAADDAVFGLPEIKVGLLPLIVMAPILRAVSRKRGMLMILSGAPVPALAPGFGDNGRQDDRIGDRCGAGRRERTGEVGRQLRRRHRGQEDLAGRGRMESRPLATAGVRPHLLRPVDLVDEHDAVAVTDGQVDALAGRRDEVGHDPPRIVADIDRIEDPCPQFEQWQPQSIAVTRWVVMEPTDIDQ